MQQIKSCNKVIIAQQIQGGFFTDIINRTYWRKLLIGLISNNENDQSDSFAG